MNRIIRDDLRTAIVVAIKCSPKLVRQGLVGKLPHQADKAADDLAELILRQVDHAHRGVFDWSPPPRNLFPSLDSFSPARERGAAAGREPRKRPI